MHVSHGVLRGWVLSLVVLYQSVLDRLLERLKNVSLVLPDARNTDVVLVEQVLGELTIADFSRVTDQFFFAEATGCFL